MLTLPDQVARLIFFNAYHPVKAWRTYLGLSVEKLAEMLNVFSETIDAIENSNAHLEKKMLTHLSHAFKVEQSLIAIRHKKTIHNKRLSFDI